MTSPRRSCFLFSEVKRETNVFNNISCILDKLKMDQNFDALSTLIQHIFTTEIDFALNGYLNRTKTFKKRFIKE